LYIPLLQILQEESNFPKEDWEFFESANNLIQQVSTEVAFKNEEDPHRDSRIGAIEGKVKVLLANFQRKFKVLNRKSQITKDNKLAF